MLRRGVGLAADVLEHPLVPHLRDHALERHVLRSAGRSGTPSRRARPNARASPRISPAPCPSGARSMKSCSTLSRKRMTSSMNSGWSFHSNQVSRFSDGQAAHRGALLAVLVDAGRQRDLAAQIGGLHLQPGQLVVLAAARGSRGRRRRDTARRSRSARSGCGSTARAPRCCAPPRCPWARAAPTARPPPPRA